MRLIELYVLRWNVEVTFEETRAHLGIETQRQWSDLAIARSTPALMGLFSVVCLMALRLTQGKSFQPQSTAWYDKQHVTFSDVLALVRREVLSHNYFIKSADSADYVQLSPQQWQALLHQLAAIA